MYLGREIRPPRVLSFGKVPRPSHDVRHEQARPAAVLKVLLGEDVGVVVAVVEGVVVTVVFGVVVGVVVDLAVFPVLLLTQIAVRAVLLAVEAVVVGFRGVAQCVGNHRGQRVGEGGDEPLRYLPCGQPNQ